MRITLELEEGQLTLMKVDCGLQDPREVVLLRELCSLIRRLGFETQPAPADCAPDSRQSSLAAGDAPPL